jgi:hypothetical protein
VCRSVDGVKLLKQPSTFPIVISQPGSYRLKKNITVPDADTTAIQIIASNVTLDLNGFGIFGPVVCTGSPVTSCAPAASGIAGFGVKASSGSVAVINGTVRGMGRIGVSVGSRSRVENVRAVSNGQGGIETAENCTISGNVAASNGSANGGIFTSASVTGNTATSNGLYGIDIGQSGTVIGNTATLNASVGLYSLDSMGSKSGYANNVLNDNNSGNANPQLFGGVQMGTNICGGDAVCP